MRILICNERFLFRFGADRVMILLGKELTQRGHAVSLMANRCDRAVVAPLFPRILDAPADIEDYSKLDEYTSNWLEQSWERCFAGSSSPDVVIVGGWPFFSAIPFFRRAGAKVVFMDHGAVPLRGYTGRALYIQQKLRALRKQFLKSASCIVAGSDFTARSQSLVDSAGAAPVSSILWGADHLESPTWSANQLPRSRTAAQSGHSATAIHDSLKSQRRRTILALGRWEPGSYKNSEAAFDLMERLRGEVPNCALLVLEERANMDLPRSLQDMVFPIGYPDDRELAEVMNRVDLGICVSQWEGFNLPLAEMQWLGRPALVFDIGAHPEVVFHPWYLCRDLGAMTTKASRILRGQGLDAATVRQSLDRFRAHFHWRRVAEEYEATIETLMRSAVAAKPAPETMTVIVDVTNATRDTANSGVIRVTRRLCRELQRRLSVTFAVWDEVLGTYVLPTADGYRLLGQFNGPALLPEPVPSSVDAPTLLTHSPGWAGRGKAWLLLAETLPERRAVEARRFARAHGMNVAALFYDAIPVLHPEWCHEEFVANHPHYMRGLAECDVVVPISRFSADCLQEFWAREGVPGCPVRPEELPGEFGRVPRCTEVMTAGDEIKLLCVSTLEPRKNHLTLIKACLRLQERLPHLNWSLTLVGNRYAGASHIADAVERISAVNPRIRWLRVVSDEVLHKLYQEATFTVYPSFVEGFGMPVLESLWHGRPCICSADNALGALAAGGGCLPTDVADEVELSEAIARLAIDRALLAKLAEQAVAREIKSWDEYVDELLSVLAETRNGDASSAGPLPDSAPTAMTGADWERIVYPGCLVEHWQMQDSERLALTAVLARQRPRCAIEVGTFEGGSLSLVSQFSELVFSIDIDPIVPEKFRQLENVRFLTGPSAAVLPLLLRELERAAVPVEFILIDGDHSREGVKRDITTVLGYTPERPLFALFHDSFNPECRRGMLEVDWNQSPYVQWVDLDFVPGRLIEHPGPFHGQLWGGLALAYFSPTRRTAPVTVNCSAAQMFKVMNDYSVAAREAGRCESAS
jgi:glycosyltransferase involved in cell wall biosynthesis